MFQSYFNVSDSFTQNFSIAKIVILLKNVILRIINLLLGFFLATVLSTLPGQTGDWTIIGSSIIVSFIEYLSRYIYTVDYTQFTCLKLNFVIRDLKIGITYGLFVDSFKLGS